MEPNTAWKFKTRQLAQKNTHGVPLYKIKEMMERYERNINLESLLLQWNLPDVQKNDDETRQDCQIHDLQKKSCDPFKMEEIAREVSAIDGQNLSEENSSDICNRGIESKSDGVCQENENSPKSDHVEEDNQKEAESFLGEEEEHVEIVDYPDSSDNEGEELFMSDSDSELKDTDSSDQPQLNPCVPEFVPLASRDNSPLTLPHLLEEGEEDWEKVATNWQGMGGLLRSLREEAGQVGFKYVSFLQSTKISFRQDHPRPA